MCDELMYLVIKILNMVFRTVQFYMCDTDDE